MEVSAGEKSIAVNNISTRNMQKNVNEAVSKGAGFCYRCGESDHLLRDCPMPFTEQLEYAPRKGVGKGTKGKVTFEVEEVNQGSDDPIFT